MIKTLTTPRFLSLCTTFLLVAGAAAQTDATNSGGSDGSKVPGSTEGSGTTPTGSGDSSSSASSSGTSAAGEAAASMEAMFRQLDTDRDGNISRSEFTAGAAKMHGGASSHPGAPSVRGENISPLHPGTGAPDAGTSGAGSQ
jgi:hypothetical protein